MLRVLLLLLSLSAVAIAPAYANDCGWANTTWNMNREEVTKALKLELLPIPVESKIKDGQFYTQNVPVGLYLYDVYYAFAMEKLYKITLHAKPEKSELGHYLQYQDAQKMLLQKFGRPAYVAPNFEWPRLQSTKWVSACTVITLTLWEGKKDDETFLTLCYEPNLGTTYDDL